jgi:seryl-tRNA synthetase
MAGGDRGPNGGADAVETRVDDPNLEFARRQTDLVLRYLEEELAKQNPDAELLDQLGWSPQDAAEFVRRWKELKQSAEDPSPKGKTAQKQLNEILKSLGLKPKSNTIQGNRQHQDELRGMDPGRDVPPPPQWSEYFQAYLKSLGATP